MLHRLMGWPVLAVTHGVVREDEDGRQLHQGREADGRPGIVAKDEKGGAKGSELGQRETVNNRSHRVFADPEMEVLPSRPTDLEISGIRQGGLVGWSEISRSPEEPRDVLRQHVQHLARSFTPGNALGVSW